jgi:hypothetical protein
MRGLVAVVDADPDREFLADEHAPVDLKTDQPHSAQPGRAR